MVKLAWFLLLSMWLNEVSANERISFAIGEWPPYTSETEKSGRLLELVVREAFKLEGVDVEYHYFPWKRSYQRVMNGEFNGTFPWNRTTDREQDFYINKVPLFKDNSVFFHLKSTHFDWHTIEDLKTYSVGATVGYQQIELYKSHGVTPIIVPSEEQNFKKMMARRIDVYETSEIVGYATIDKLFGKEKSTLFTHHPRPAEENIYYILFRKTPDSLTMIKKLDAGLEKLIASGRYQKIMQGMPDMNTGG